MSELRYQISKGTPLPLGATKEGDAINMAIVAPACDVCKIIFYHKKDRKKNFSVTIPTNYCVGDVYCVKIHELPYSEYEYVYEIDDQIVIDPYAKVIRGREKWGKVSNYFEPTALRCGFDFDDFDWKEDHTLEIPYKDLVIYKMHVRGFTKHSSSGCGKMAGTFRGVMQKIPYLKELGVNAVLLMPIVEFDEILIEENFLRAPGAIGQPTLPPQMANSHAIGQNTAVEKAVAYEFVNIAKDESNYRMTMLEEGYTREMERVRIPYRINYWGYSKDNYYFAPKSSYAYDTEHVNEELKTMIYELHQAGIEVIMEFNFTPDLTQQTILDCLHYWFFQYHIDGFSVNSNVVSTKVLASDPVLSRTKFLATSWDMQQIYSSKGQAIKAKSYRNLAEYNDGFLVDARKYLKSDEEQVGPFSFRLKRNPKEYAVINYITNNNGFTLMDLVSYDLKHNLANGEDNKDGTDYNYSWNCGTEGRTGKKKIKELRRKQIRNALVMLMLSQGTPMIMMGDEFGNSQLGNNNAYCQDNITSWLNWNLRKTNSDIETLVKELITIRRKYGVFGKEEEYRMMDSLSCGCPDISFHGTKAWYPDFSNYSRVFGVMYCGQYATIENGKSADSFYIAYNMHWENHEFDLPQLPMNQSWSIYLDTSLQEKREIHKSNRLIQVSPRSIVVLKSKVKDSKVENSKVENSKVDKQ